MCQVLGLRHSRKNINMQVNIWQIHTVGCPRGKWDTISNHTRTIGVNWVCSAQVSQYGPLLVWNTPVHWWALWIVNIQCCSSPSDWFLFTKTLHWRTRYYDGPRDAWVAEVYNQLYTSYKRSQGRAVSKHWFLWWLTLTEPGSLLLCYLSSGAFCCTWHLVWCGGHVIGLLPLMPLIISLWLHYCSTEWTSYK